jgi:predicted O-methyltransferase YrrM
VYSLVRVLTHFLLWNVGLARAETQTSEAERACLARHAAGRRRLAEVGVWHGVTTCRLRRAMASDGLLFGIDPYPTGRLGFSAQRAIARSEVARSPGGEVRWLRLTGVEAALCLAEAGEPPVDFVFIDGDHSYDGLRGDWGGRVTPGGVVALHDSCSSAEREIEDAGSVRYTREVIRRDARYEVAEVVDTLTVLRRKAGE